MTRIHTIFIGLLSVLVIGLFTVGLALSVAAHSGGDGGGGDGRDRDTSTNSNDEGDKPPGGFDPIKRKPPQPPPPPKPPKPPKPSPANNDPRTAPYGQVIAEEDGTIVIEPPPQFLDWDMESGPLTPDPMTELSNKRWSFDAHPELVFSLDPKWALHNLSLLLQTGQMTLGEYLGGVASVLGVPPGTKVRFDGTVPDDGKK